MDKSKGNPTANSTKVWLTQSGGCIVCHNKSKIPEKELNIICEDISLHIFKLLKNGKQFIQVILYFIAKSFVDKIVERKDMKETLYRIIKLQ